MKTTSNAPSLNTHHFADRLLTWFEQSGRHDLPWQFHQHDQADIYAVWLSEVMLQQTQVATVLNYFPRFYQQFPTVEELALADWDQVAQLWAGLGYYARAKNLHQGAKQVAEYRKQHGHFPKTVEEWQTIKGVGRSTAGAIVAMGVRGFGVICDGNVKRVLTRHQAIDGDITKSATDKQLWALATDLTPAKSSGKYAQAMMDLGATVCTRTKPKCTICPLSADCLAFLAGNPAAYPVKAKSTPKPHRHSLAISLSHQGRSLWLKRENAQKSTGIWEGLWCLPLLTLSQTDDAALTGDALTASLGIDDLDHDKHQFGEMQLLDYLLKEKVLASQAPTKPRHIRHTLSHFHWHLYQWPITLSDEQFWAINELLKHARTEHIWASGDDKLAMPTAMHKLLS